MKKLLDGLTANGSGPKLPIVDGRTYAVALASGANFGGGTLELELFDNDTSTKLATTADKYQFTEAFEPFEITLAPGMAVQMTLSGAGAADLTAFLYKSED